MYILGLYITNKCVLEYNDFQECFWKHANCSHHLTNGVGREQFPMAIYKQLFAERFRRSLGVIFHEIWLDNKSILIKQVIVYLFIYLFAYGRPNRKA